MHGQGRMQLTLVIGLLDMHASCCCHPDLVARPGRWCRHSATMWYACFYIC